MPSTVYHAPIIIFRQPTSLFHYSYPLAILYGYSRWIYNCDQWWWRTGYFQATVDTVSVIFHVFNTHLQVLPLSVYWSVVGGNLSGWLTAQLQPFSDIFSSVPHTQPSIQTHCTDVCHLDFSFIPVYLVPFHHTPGPQHSHNHLFTNNHLARQCLTSLYSGLFLSHTSELHAQPVEYC